MNSVLGNTSIEDLDVFKNSFQRNKSNKNALNSVLSFCKILKNTYFKLDES